MRPVAEERVRARAEDPGGIAELGLGLEQDGALAVADPLEVPPAAPVAREDELAARAPLRLPDRLLAAPARDVLDVAERPVVREVGDEELAAVPRHPREVPGEEARAACRRGEMRGLE